MSKIYEALEKAERDRQKESKKDLPPIHGLQEGVTRDKRSGLNQRASNCRSVIRQFVNDP